eukprot:CAMPEP_0183762274 /NCGR_PEP_ID=MMETSP0739-20130205/8968_1 /TAXON_ID=385413 /ORGANISM="Thalassiosira miniscula, Strain CCMP1093" /LENGTH=63 /DNA_ID=CAMNT_0026000539 /DNA_START=240 /DNA_END=428 /DNA_ORIENTATION=+
MVREAVARPLWIRRRPRRDLRCGQLVRGPPHPGAHALLPRSLLALSEYGVLDPLDLAQSDRQW